MQNQKTKKLQLLAGILPILVAVSLLLLPFVRQGVALPATVEPPIIEIHYRFLIGILIQTLICGELCMLLVASQILICILLIAAGVLTLRKRSAKSFIISAVVSAVAAVDLVSFLFFREKVFDALETVYHGWYQYSFGFWIAAVCAGIALICCLCSLFSLRKAAED